MKAYRYESYNTCDSEGASRTVRVHVIEFDVEKATPCGFWITRGAGYTSRRFVKSPAKKQYAHTSQEDALTSFKARKKRQIEILANQLQDAKEALEIAENTKI